MDDAKSAKILVSEPFKPCPLNIQLQPTQNTAAVHLQSTVHPALFLVADTQLNKRLCLSFGPSVCRVKKWKTSVLDMLCVCLSVGWVLGCGLDAPTHPSATTL